MSSLIRSKGTFLNISICSDWMGSVNHWTLANKLLDRNVPLHIVKLFIFWYREQGFMVRWGNSLSMTFHCSNGIRQGRQLSPLLYNVYTDDQNDHLQATGVGCYVGGAWVNSLSYTDDMVFLHPRWLLFRHCWRYVAHMLHLMTLYTTQRKQYVCLSDQSSHRVSTQQESGSEMRNLASSRSFVT